MKGFTIGAALVAAALVTPALAANAPPMHPTHDVAVVYQVEGTGRGGASSSRVIRMFWGDDGNALRIEVGGLGKNPPAVALVDFKRQRMTMMISNPKVFLQTKLDPQMVPGFVIPQGADVRRGGTDTVAGIPCDVWIVSGARGNGEACITADGVVLRAGGEATQAGSGQLIATSVAYGPQPESLFIPPPGFARMDLGAPRK